MAAATSAGQLVCKHAPASAWNCPFVQRQETSVGEHPFCAAAGITHPRTQLEITVELPLGAGAVVIVDEFCALTASARAARTTNALENMTVFFDV